MWGYCWLSCALAVTLSGALSLAVLAYVDDFIALSPFPCSLDGVLQIHDALGIPIHRSVGK